LINKLSIIAKVLFPYRKIGLILMVLFALGIVYSFLFHSPAEQNLITLPLFLAMLWLLMCYLLLVFIQSNADRVVLESSNKLSIINRISNFFKRGFYYCIGLLFLAIMLALSIITLRIFTVWF
tara:strand:- start:220 stop:588 length:369 start_codon:yes stop_codon:yes gene_type:complete